MNYNIDLMFERKLKETAEDFKNSISEKVKDLIIKDSYPIIENVIEKELPMYMKNISINEIKETVLNQIDINQIQGEIKNSLEKRFIGLKLLRDLWFSNQCCKTCNLPLKPIVTKTNRFTFYCENCKTWTNLPRNISETLTQELEKW